MNPPAWIGFPAHPIRPLLTKDPAEAVNKGQSETVLVNLAVNARRAETRPFPQAARRPDALSRAPSAGGATYFRLGAARTLSPSLRITACTTPQHVGPVPGLSIGWSEDNLTHRGDRRRHAAAVGETLGWLVRCRAESVRRQAPRISPASHAFARWICTRRRNTPAGEGPPAECGA